MNLTILGGGLSGLSLAYFLQGGNKFDSITILEKEERPGGLCRSLTAGGYTYDIGPHILFAKDKEMLNLLIEWAGKTNKLRRSNRILHKGAYVQYPFENDLSKLPKEDLEYAVKTFLHNPYSEYVPENMLQFFLKTFGEGITNLYLRPYNEKIWKHDPCFMDTQTVERIPKPTDEELMRSARGETVDGYVHQLYFDFPSEGGIESVIKGLIGRLGNKCEIVTGAQVTAIRSESDGFEIKAGEKVYRSDSLVSTMSLPEFVEIDADATDEIRVAASDLKYNSIIIALVKAREDLSGENFAFMTTDKSVLFHRISKIDFLGDAYHQDGAAYMVEVTYRQGDWIDQLSDVDLKNKIAEGLKKIGFVKETSDATFLNVTKHKYAYVLYELKHKANMDLIRKYYCSRNIYLNGRFGNFEYWNMDKVVRESKKLADEILG